MNPASSTHLVLIPSYNPGPKVFDTVRAARQQWNPVWVVVDGSTDGTERQLAELAQQDAGLRVLLPQNRGKGAAVLHGLDEAARLGFTHALCMDSDGPAPGNADSRNSWPARRPTRCDGARSAGIRCQCTGIARQGRRISNWWANLETLWMGIGDSLFGFRVYPVEPLRRLMHGQRWMRRFDFDPEAVVRLCWRSVRQSTCHRRYAISVPTKAAYRISTTGATTGC